MTTRYKSLNFKSKILFIVWNIRNIVFPCYSIISLIELWSNSDRKYFSHLIDSLYISFLTLAYHSALLSGEILYLRSRGRCFFWGWALKCKFFHVTTKHFSIIIWFSKYSKNKDKKNRIWEKYSNSILSIM